MFFPQLVFEILGVLYTMAHTSLKWTHLKYSIAACG